MSQAYAQLQAYTLAGGGTAIGDTTVTLTTSTDIDGNTLSMTDFGAKGFATIEPNSQQQEEQISFTGITVTSGQASLTGVKHVGFLTPYTETTGVSKSHAGGVKLVFSNTSGFYNTFANKNNNETIAGQYTFPSANIPVYDTHPTFTTNTQIVDKKYVDDTVISGAANASTTVKGIVQLATSTDASSGTATGSTGAALVPPNSLFNATSSAAVLIPVTNSSGKISSGFGGAASSLATLDGSSLVVQNPTNATATPTSSKIPISSASTVLDVGWIDTGTTANKIVKLDGSALLPAVDGSALTNMRAVWNRVGTTVTINQSCTNGVQTKIAEWTGLTGDTDDVYYIEFEMSPGTNFSTSDLLVLRLNDDSTVNHYGFANVKLAANSATAINSVSAFTSTAHQLILATANIILRVVSGTVLIKGSKTIAGTGRNIISDVVATSTNDSTIGTERGNGAWTDVTNQITSIQLYFTPNGGTTTAVGKATLYKINR